MSALLQRLQAGSITTLDLIIVLAAVLAAFALGAYVNSLSHHRTPQGESEPWPTKDERGDPLPANFPALSRRGQRLYQDGAHLRVTTNVIGWRVDQSAITGDTYSEEAWIESPDRFGFWLVWLLPVPADQPEEEAQENEWEALDQRGHSQPVMRRRARSIVFIRWDEVGLWWRDRNINAFY